MFRYTSSMARPRRRVMRSTMVAVLTMAAMVLGLLALHSAASGDETSGSVSVVSTSSGRFVAEGGTEIASPSFFYVDSGSNTVGDGLLAGCMIMGIACLALLVLSSVVILASRSAVYRRLLDAGGFVAHSFREIPLHLHRPSLTFLSISRV